MGSRTKPNHGGSGLSFSRKSRPAPLKRPEIKYTKIETLEELDLYLSGSKIACLLCGSEFRMLGRHLSATHSLSSSEYKEMFNIPVTRSLSCNDLQLKKRDITKGIWETQPKMERVRDRLKRDIKRLQKASRPTRSTIRDSSSLKKAVEVRQAMLIDKHRPVYMDVMRYAIENDLTLYCACKEYAIHVSSIYKFQKNHGEDAEFADLLGQIREPTQKPAGEGRADAVCAVCRKPFKSRTDRPQTCCSMSCSGKLKSETNRLAKSCVVCGKQMNLTKTNFERISTCSKECSTIRRSRQNSKR